MVFPSEINFQTVPIIDSLPITEQVHAPTLLRRFTQSFIWFYREAQRMVHYRIQTFHEISGGNNGGEHSLEIAMLQREYLSHRRRIFELQFLKCRSPLYVAPTTQRVSFLVAQDILEYTGAQVRYGDYSNLDLEPVSEADVEPGYVGYLSISLFATNLYLRIHYGIDGDDLSRKIPTTGATGYEIVYCEMDY